jgi:predicted regulator of Ras-like GTPase activity (Roadblock/LC7/MglB family)
MPSYQTFTVPRSVTLSAEHMERVEECLDEFARNTGALNILLTDPTGQLITIRGRIDKKKAEPLAALIAGSHAASAEFIKLLGKAAPFVNLSHEADDYSIYSTNVADELILSVAFGEEVKIGIVRVFIEQARRSLSEIVHEASLANSDGDKVKIRLVDEDFDHFLDKEFEELTDYKKVKEKNRR